MEGDRHGLVQGARDERRVDNDRRGLEVSLEAAVGLRKGTLDLDVELEVADDEVVWGPALAPVPAGPLRWTG